MTTHTQALEDCFQMTLNEILTSDLLDNYEDESTLSNYELSDLELQSLKYMYDINKKDNIIYIYNENFTLTSTHKFHDPKIKLTDEIALQLINLEKQIPKP